MKFAGRHYRTIWPGEDRSCVHIIDQRQLPHTFHIEQLTSLEEAVTAIREMHVRGAGLIGATAGFGMFLAARHADSGNFAQVMQNAAERLDASRPTARNLKWAIERVMRAMAEEQTIEAKQNAAFKTACDIADEDAGFCRRIGQHGLSVIQKISEMKNGAPVNILTHCNAGWLAFVDYGSATAPVYAARDAGIPLHVWVDETRPWNQGARLTVWELHHENIDHTLICDNTGGHLMQHGMVDMVIVGSDRTTACGDVANKIGTYLKALAAKDNNIPFFVALPSSTIDWDLDNGMLIPIEQRSGAEITTISGIDGAGNLTAVEITVPGTKAANYGFDVTPARLVTGIITERGIAEASRESLKRLFPEHGNRP